MFNHTQPFINMKFLKLKFQSVKKIIVTTLKNKQIKLQKQLYVPVSEEFGFDVNFHGRKLVKLHCRNSF